MIGPAIRQWRLLLVAVQFLTRVPVPVAYVPGDLDRAARYFPLVGAGIGLVGAGVFALAGIGLPAGVAAVLAVLATVLLTGGLHEDGLADTCDGMFGGRTRDDALRIMRDSRIGAYGAIGLALMLGLKVAALSAAPALALVAGQAGSRLMMVGVIASAPYARPGTPLIAGVGRTELLVAVLCGAAPCLVLGLRAIPALLLAGLVAWGVAAWMRRRLGGWTGDTLGAVQQVTEATILLAALWHAA